MEQNLRQQLDIALENKADLRETLKLKTNLDPGNVISKWPDFIENMPDTLKEALCKNSEYAYLFTNNYSRAGKLYGSTSLKHLVIGEEASLKTLGTYICAECSNLETVNSDTPGEVIVPEGTTLIGNSAFLNCTKIKYVDIPDSVTSIGGEAFKGCTSLQNILLSNSLISFSGDYTFQDCTSLNIPEFPSTLTNAGAYTFYGAKCAGRMDLSNTGVTSIKVDFIMDSLVSLLILPNTCTSIVDYGLWHNYSLKLLDFGNTRTTICSLGGTHLTFHSTAKIVVPDSLYSSWIAATNWSNSAIKSKIISYSDYYTTSEE